MQPTRSLAFHTCDVFTRQRFGGNPLAVVLDAQGLTDQQMQAIAREFNYSETVFVLPPITADHAAQIRIFTPARELPFAGHPTIGTAYVIAREIDGFAAADALVLEERVGPVRVELLRQGDALHECRFAAPRLPQQGSPAPAREQLAAMLNLPVSTVLDSAEFWSCGVEYLVVPLASVEALRRCRLDLAVWDRLLEGRDSKHVYPVAPAGSAWRVRMFAPDSGVAEDPATGSAAAAFGGWLAHYAPQATPRSQFTLLQGEEIGRPSQLDITIERDADRVTAVHVQGACIAVSRGTLLV